MYRELSCYDSDLKKQEIIKSCFLSIHKNFNGFCVPEHFLSSVKEFMPQGMVLAAPIDYPKGFSSSQAKLHSITSCIRKGANAVDVVLNKNICTEKDLDKLGENVSAYSNLCKQKACSLRIMLEYRLYEDPDFVYDLCEICQECGADYIFVSTGSMADDISDHLITAKIVEEMLDIDIIYNADIWTAEQYEKIAASEVFGVRIKKANAVTNIFGVL